MTTSHFLFEWAFVIRSLSLAMVAYAFNLSTEKTEAGCFIEWALGQAPKLGKPHPPSVKEVSVSWFRNLLVAPQKKPGIVDEVEKGWEILLSRYDPAITV